MYWSKHFVFSLKQLIAFIYIYIFLKLIRFSSALQVESFCISLATRKSALISWPWYISTHCSLAKMLHYCRHRANLLCCISHMRAWQKKFSFHSSSSAAWRWGPTEQRQYFTVGWQAAAKVFTALLQCGKMDPERRAQVEAWENQTGFTLCCLVWQCTQFT